MVDENIIKGEKCMYKTVKRFISFLVVIMLSAMTVHATEISKDDSMIRVTDELALQMAENFASGVGENSNIIAVNPKKFYDVNGQAIGYIVNFILENEPYGYVVFDTTNESLISEYSFGYNSRNPYEIICEREDTIFKEKENDPEIFKINPFTYGVIDNSNKIKTNYGQTLEKTILSENKIRSVNPTTWSDVLLDIKDVYEKYTLVSGDHLPQFIAFGQGFIENETQRYACAVTALLACAAYYNAVDYGNLADDYINLWNATGTTTYLETGEREYGTTSIGNVGPGFVNFCAGKNIIVRQNTNHSPRFNFFTNCINRGDIAVVHCGLDSGDGHAMAVEGYTTLLANNSGNMIHTLMVADGWGESVRYLNFDFTNWEYISGTAFSS